MTVNYHHGIVIDRIEPLDLVKSMTYAKLCRVAGQCSAGSYLAAIESLRLADARCGSERVRLIFITVGYQKSTSKTARGTVFGP